MPLGHQPRLPTGTCAPREQPPAGVAHPEALGLDGVPKGWPPDPPMASICALVWPICARAILCSEAQPAWAMGTATSRPSPKATTSSIMTMRPAGRCSLRGGSSLYDEPLCRPSHADAAPRATLRARSAAAATTTPTAVCGIVPEPLPSPMGKNHTDLSQRHPGLDNSRSAGRPLQPSREEGFGCNYTGLQDASTEGVSADLPGERIGTACISAHHGWIYLPVAEVWSAKMHRWVSHTAEEGDVGGAKSASTVAGVRIMMALQPQDVPFTT